MEEKLRFYNDEGCYIKCYLCPHNCSLNEGKFGVCKLRTVKNNIPIVINYGEVTSANMDPIEKKPLYHFKPGRDILSVGTFGCNMSCSFCQNHEISQNKPSSEFIDIDKLINLIINIPNNVGIAFTYNEPFMWYEYVYDVAKKIKEYDKSISVVLVTNGFVNKEPLEEILPYVDAMNIDLKGFTKKYYNEICGATMEPVLETIKIASKYTHVEITTLMVSDANDSVEEIVGIAKLLSAIDKNIPLHLSRYFPQYKMKNQPTLVENIMKAKEEAKKYLNYVYVGNVAGVDNNTYCQNCGYNLVTRDIYTTNVHIKGDKCPNCKEYINIIS
ncbi:AmmeMemoRadiSam system radical SAM enzyme [Terrisporobacter mayombei]|uniref:GTP 3',8-cyclase n=1 Tax=Terrisporobacter mayombei TaxID=1541 RepID=A0ABY9Q6R0_9FIRM|nr:AmmeMemoRadiSam system radical SAM enzyme [Terrisporobacter mayombei]MCC3869824.1 AmmeMemoRadiSam system radical SAM enzyme [Terrisporobacter mayombei]WMT83236.1 GTP 3',8-cyclase [Terrisporobacter mayombei]